jgi:hypothetical protein
VQDFPNINPGSLPHRGKVRPKSDEAARFWKFGEQGNERETINQRSNAMGSPSVTSCAMNANRTEERRRIRSEPKTSDAWQHSAIQSFSSSSPPGISTFINLQRYDVRFGDQAKMKSGFDYEPVSPRFVA